MRALAEAVVPMTSQIDHIAGAHGVQLAIHRWPVANPRACVILVHGYGEHLGRYHHVVAALNTHGYSVAGIDNRGHGLSSGRRADVFRFDDFVDDLHTFVTHIRDEEPALPRFMLGHSIGGLIATRYALHHQDQLAGLILSGAAIHVGGSTPLLLHRLAPIVARLAPTLPVMEPRDPGILSRDPDIDRRWDTDPLTYKGKLRARFGHQLQAAAANTQTRLDQLTLPVLIMHGATDRLTDPQGSVLIHDRAQSPDKTLILWPNLRHEIFNEPEQAAVIAFTIQWLDARTPAP